LTEFFQFPSVRSLAQHLTRTSAAMETAAAAGASRRGEAQRQALNRFHKPPIPNP
jgi:hypothetical protein